MSNTVLILDDTLYNLQRFLGTDFGFKAPEPDPNEVAVVICNKCKTERPNYTGTLQKPFRCTCGYLYGHYKKPYEWVKK